MQIKDILKNNIKLLNQNNIENASLKARIILAHVLGITKEQLIVKDLMELDDTDAEKYTVLIEELIQRKPLQYITKHQEFMKLNFYVDENVLIPRADTETLVEEVINICNKNVDTTYKILDLCAGSGAIGISIAKYVDNVKVLESDISTKALEIAKNNANKNDVYGKLQFIYSDMFNNIQDKFDIIVSNPPYIKTDIIKTLDKEVQNEPYIALDGGEDGLDFYRIIVDNAYKYLKPNGYICLEIGYDQKEEVIKLLNESNQYTNIRSKKDLYENDRIIIAEKSNP